MSSGSSVRFEPKLNSSQIRRPASMDSSMKLGQSRQFFHANNLVNNDDDDSSTSLSSDEDLYVSASPPEVVALADSLVHVSLPGQIVVDPYARTPRSKKGRKPHRMINGHRSRRNKIDVDALTPRVASLREIAATSKRPHSDPTPRPSNLSGLGLLDKALSPNRAHSHQERRKKGHHNRHLLSTPRSSDEMEVKQVHIKASSNITPTSMPQRVEKFNTSKSVSKGLLAV